jgi:hypothetical protein
VEQYLLRYENIKSGLCFKIIDVSFGIAKIENKYKNNFEKIPVLGKYLLTLKIFKKIIFLNSLFVDTAKFSKDINYKDFMI